MQASILLSAFALLSFSLWLWALLDLSRTSFKDSRMTILWWVVILLFPLIGSIFYFQLKRKFTHHGQRVFLGGMTPNKPA